MRIPNMCLVLKFDNGKVVSIADEQNHRQTDVRTKPPSTVLAYRYSIQKQFKVKPLLLCIQYRNNFKLYHYCYVFNREAILKYIPLLSCIQFKINFKLYCQFYGIRVIQIILCINISRKSFMSREGALGSITASPVPERTV